MLKSSINFELFFFVLFCCIYVTYTNVNIFIVFSETQNILKCLITSSIYAVLYFNKYYNLENSSMLSEFIHFCHIKIILQLYNFEN